MTSDWVALSVTVEFGSPDSRGFRTFSKARVAQPSLPYSDEGGSYAEFTGPSCYEQAMVYLRGALGVRA